MAAAFERTSAPLVLKRPPPCAASCSRARAGARLRGPDRGLGGDAGLAAAFDPAGERGASQAIFRHQIAPGLACEVEPRDLPPELLRELPGMVGIRHCRAFLGRFLSPSPNCLTKCSQSRCPPPTSTATWACGRSSSASAPPRLLLRPLQDPGAARVGPHSAPLLQVRHVFRNIYVFVNHEIGIWGC